MEAIILAGGLGTRLQGVIGKFPKPMAVINDRPFLEYLFDYLISQDVESVILAVGFQQHIIKDHFKEGYKDLKIEYSSEDEPLGTGGAILLALEKSKTNDLFIINGDTFFPVNLKHLLNSHLSNRSICTLAIKEMNDFDRYGCIEVDDQGKVLSFREKDKYDFGFINGGIYCLNKKEFYSYNFPNKFSFEQDFLEKYVGQNIFTEVFSEYFIDIGIPKDYERAQEEFKRF